MNISLYPPGKTLTDNISSGKKVIKTFWPIATHLLLLLFIIACDNQSEREGIIVSSFFQDLVGAWQVEDENSFEEWYIGPDSTITALAFALEGDDTLVAEHIRIVNMDGQWFYEATVSGQNDDQPVRFHLTSCSDSSLTFSNLEHDFPQSIKYEKIDDNRMKATISGAINRNPTSYEFNYVRYMKKKKVTGIGGIFFKCENPEKMRAWYAENLGLVTNEYGSLFEFRLADEPDKKGYLQWSPFDKNTRYFEPSEKEFMINYRVENMEELVEELKKDGVTILDSIEYYEYGKFVHILDPENNKIELWEPVESEFTKNYEGQTTK
jgi:predicted enzyme related to lactoylglutathione lyase